MSNISEDKCGYRQPPKAHRFKKGESGNPGGKRKKLDISLYDRLIKMLEMRANADQTILDLVMKNLIKLALGGDVKSSFKLLELYILAKRYASSKRDDESEDLDAARRLFELDPRFLSEIVKGKDEASEGAPDSQDTGPE